MTLLLLPTLVQASFPKLKGYVNDSGQKLKPKYVGLIENIITELEQKTGVEIYIAIVESLDGFSPDDYAAALYKRWRIGYRKKGEGVLLLVGLENRKMRIIAGDGLKEVITTRISRQLKREKILPLFSRGEYSAGILVAVSSMTKLISEKKGVKIKQLNFKRDNRPVMIDPVTVSLVFSIIIITLVLIGVPFFTRVYPKLKKRF